MEFKFIKMKKKGFTLIELLVVIAIIGLLASIVLVSLQSARLKASDAKLKSEMANLRTAASIYYTEHSLDYTGLFQDSPPCDTDEFLNPNIRSILLSIGASAGDDTHCGFDANSYAVSVALPGGGFWCVDSAGSAKSVLSNVANYTGTVCP